MPCPPWWVTVNAPSALIASTVQVSRLRTGSPVVVTQSAVVAAGGDDVTDVHGFATSDRRCDGGVEVAGVAAGGLDGVVDQVDVVVGRGDHGDAATAVVVVDPGGGEPVEVFVEAAGDDPAVRLVGVEGAWVAQRGVGGTRSLPRGG